MRLSTYLHCILLAKEHGTLPNMMSRDDWDFDTGIDVWMPEASALSQALPPACPAEVLA